MTTIETTIEVDEQRKATIQLPANMKPGPYRVVVVVESQEPDVARVPLPGSTHGAGSRPEGSTGHRGEISELPPSRSVLEFLDALPPGPRSAPTWDEIERRFQEERAAWDRETSWSGTK